MVKKYLVYGKYAHYERNKKPINIMKQKKVNIYKTDTRNESQLMHDLSEKMSHDMYSRYKNKDMQKKIYNDSQIKIVKV